MERDSPACTAPDFLVHQVNTGMDYEEAQPQ